MTERRKPPNTWINWRRIRPDYEAGMPAVLCAKRENDRLKAEGENRRVTTQAIRSRAYLKGWGRPWLHPLHP